MRDSLLEAGCSIAQVAAITGQTYKIVEHYAANVNTRKLGSAAIVNLDDMRSEQKRTGKTPATPERNPNA